VSGINASVQESGAMSGISSANTWGLSAADPNARATHAKTKRDRPKRSLVILVVDLDMKWIPSDVL